MIVRRDARIAAEHAVDVGPLQPGIGDCKRRGLAHEVERGRAFMLAVGRQANAGDEAHGHALSFESITAIAGYGFRTCT